MGVGAVLLAHAFDRASELIRVSENICVFCKEAKDQPRHKMVHIMAALSSAPFRIVFKQLNVEAIEATSGLNIKRAFADFFNRADTSKR